MRLMRTPSVGWTATSEHYSKEQIKNKNTSRGGHRQRCRLPRRTASHTPTSILVPASEHQEFPWLLVHEEPPLNRLPRPQFAVAPRAYRRCRAMSLIEGKADDMCSWEFFAR